MLVASMPSKKSIIMNLNTVSSVLDFATIGDGLTYPPGIGLTYPPGATLTYPTGIASAYPADIWVDI